MKKQKTKIIFSNYDDMKNPVYAGGGAFAVHEVAKRLTINFDVAVLTGNYTGAQNEIVDGVAYIRIGLSFLGGKLGQLFYHFFLPWHVLTKKYDVWIESFTPPFSTSFTSLFTSKPVFGLIHMLAGKDMERKYHLPFSAVENFGLKHYRHFIVLTEHSASEVAEQNPSANIEIIGNGVYSPALPNDLAKGKYIAYVGRIEVDQKGLDLLIAAYAKIREKINIPLHIAGAGSPKEIAHLEKLMDKYSVRESVHILGRITGEQKNEFFRNAMIGIIPSRYETQSLVALEMMSYGIPIVAFDIDGLRWVPTEAIVRVPSFDVEAFSREMANLVRNEELRRTLALHARECAKKYDWDIVAKKYEQYIVRAMIEAKQNG